MQYSLPGYLDVDERKKDVTGMMSGCTGFKVQTCYVELNWVQSPDGLF